MTKEGIRVKVWSEGKDTYLGEGTITKVEPLYVEMDEEENGFEKGERILAMEKYPSEITLDNGDITEGLECWWLPIDENGEVVKDEDYIGDIESVDCKGNKIVIKNVKGRRNPATEEEWFDVDDVAIAYINQFGCDCEECVSCREFLKDKGVIE